jgi:hypothetical protein
MTIYVLSVQMYASYHLIDVSGLEYFRSFVYSLWVVSPRIIKLIKGIITYIYFYHTTKKCSSFWINY